MSGQGSGGCETLFFEVFAHVSVESLHNAVTTLLHFLALFLLLFWCCGLCAAHLPPAQGTPSVPDTRYKLPNLALKAFLSLKSIAIKTYLKVRLGIQA